MSRDTRVLERLFDQYNIPLDIDDCATYDDYEWCFYTSTDLFIQVDATFNFNEPNEYEATVYINSNDGIEKHFKEGEEMELIKFISTDKMKLAENRALENINKDFQ